MPRADRFFVWIWRLNALLLLMLALVVVAGAAATLIVNGALFWAPKRPPQQLANVAGAELGAKNLRLGHFRPIAGTPLLYAALETPSKYIGSGSIGTVGSARNLLFFDIGTRKAHWLLPDNNQTIESFTFLMDPPAARYAYNDGEAQTRNQVALAILLELQRDDPSAPHAVSRRLAIAPPDGRTIAALADSTDALLGYHQPGRNSVLVFYLSAGTARVLDADLATWKVRSNAPLGQ
jgi:hypothetical protein